MRAAFAVCAALSTAGCNLVLGLDEVRRAPDDASSVVAADADRVDATPDVIDATPAQAPADATVDATVDAGPDAASACPASYTLIGSTSRYRLVTTNTDWLAAERDCEHDGPVNHLVVIDDAEELAFLIPSIAAKTWVGLSDRITEGTWLRVIGGAAGFQPWNSGEPNDMFGEDCATISGVGLIDEGCADLSDYLCECDGHPAVPGAYTSPP